MRQQVTTNLRYY